jgi:hypothetical protein
MPRSLLQVTCQSSAPLPRSRRPGAATSGMPNNPLQPPPLRFGDATRPWTPAPHRRPSRPRLRTRRVRRAAPSRCPNGRARGLATHPRRGRTGCGEGTRTPAQAAGAGVAKLKAVGRTSRGRPQMHRHAGDAARISILRAWLQMLSGWCWACAHSALSTEAAPGM